MSKLYVGIDEVGVSSVAGPMVAAAVILPKNHGISKLPVDSKDLSDTQITELAKEIRSKAIYYKIVEVDNNQVNEWGEQKSVRKLWNRLSRIRQKKSYKYIEIIVDGENKIPALKNDANHKAIAHADGKYDNVSAAAIIAKDYCDDIMRKLHKEFPMYNFAKNKGYGRNVSDHIEALKKYGVCKYHREKAVNKLLKTQGNLEEEKNNTDINIYLLQEIVICGNILLDKYPDKFGPFVRGIFKREYPKIINGVKPSPKMQHCLSRNFLSMFRFACKDSHPTIDRSPLMPKSENIVKPNVINFFKDVFTKEYEDTTGCKAIYIPEDFLDNDKYSYDELYMMVQIINTINTSINKNLSPDIDKCIDDIIGIFNGEIPSNNKQNALAEVTLESLNNIGDFMSLDNKSKFQQCYNNGIFTKDLYNIFKDTFWIEDEEIFFIKKELISNMMFLLGLINVNFKDKLHVFDDNELAFCKNNYKSIVQGKIPPITKQLFVNNLLIIVSIRIFEYYNKLDIVEKLRDMKILSSPDVQWLVLEIDILLNNNILSKKYTKFTLENES